MSGQDNRKQAADAPDTGEGKPEEGAVSRSETEGDKKTESISSSERKGEKKSRQARHEEKESKKKNKKNKRKYRLTGSLAGKAAAFFLLAVFSLAAAASLLVCIYMGIRGYYSLSANEVLKKELYEDTYDIIYEVKDYLEQGELESAGTLCRESDLDMQLVWLYADNKEMELWKSWKNEEQISSDMYTEMIFSFKYVGHQVNIGTHRVGTNRRYLLRVYMNTAFPTNIGFRMTWDTIAAVHRYRYELIGLCGVCVILSILCFVFLMCGAGRRRNREGIVPGFLTRLPVDAVTLLFCGAGGLLIFLLRYIGRYEKYQGMMNVLIPVAGMAEVLLLNRYCADMAVRVKMGKWWQHVLILRLPGKLWKEIRKAGRRLASFIAVMPLMVTILSAYFILCLLEYVGLSFFIKAREGYILWGLEKGILLIALVYIGKICKEMLMAGRALAQGREDYRIDTSGMHGIFKEHGENLNSVGQGIAKAVAERIKSEHLKTELISNVSHDLKTPLTSIINYADLICEETKTPGEASPERDARIQEYSEVLLRQSRRLKKLLEDLLEASKATTGNLEVNLVPCEVGVLLSQTVGEYQQRMEEKELQLIARQPEQPVNIVADVRHLWRVFDNLLNNICKYAQEHSRVYLNVEAEEGYAVIIFRNMSKYPLDISAEELEERFVRGDKSRHMEGNGLGLSIAKSLMELQNGKMEIVIDGDLFKVILRFPEYLQENG